MNTFTAKLQKIGIRLPKLPPYLVYDLVFWGFIGFTALTTLVLALTASPSALLTYHKTTRQATSIIIWASALYFVVQLFRGRIWQGKVVSDLMLVVANSMTVPITVVVSSIVLVATTLPRGVDREGSIAALLASPFLFAVTVWTYYRMRNDAKATNAQLPPLFFRSYRIAVAVELILLVVFIRLF